jgi:hypothetical protein
MTTAQAHEKIADAFHQLRRGCYEAACMVDDLRKSLDRIQSTLTQLAQLDPLSSADIQRLTNRLARIHELRRSMEIGSLGIEVGRVVDSAWRRLP